MRERLCLTRTVSNKETLRQEEIKIGNNQLPESESTKEGRDESTQLCIRAPVDASRIEKILSLSSNPHRIHDSPPRSAKEQLQFRTWLASREEWWSSGVEERVVPGLRGRTCRICSSSWMCAT